MAKININNYSSLILILTIISFLFQIINSQVDMTDYDYPKPNQSSDIITVAIMGTNDVHGEVFPNNFKAPNNTVISTGGGTNIYSYTKILREEWGDYFLWLDGGDQFQGTMECMLSEGDVMKDFYNYAKVDGIAIGNHEFDYGIEHLKNFYTKQKFPTLCANLYDLNEKKYIWEEGMWENVEPYHIYELGNETKIKIGVIGLATKETVLYSDTDLSSLEFGSYIESTKKFVNILKNEEKVDAVVLLVHFGPKCSRELEEKMKLKVRTKNDVQLECDEGQEIMQFLDEIKNENIKIDAMIGAHIHDIVHHWINDIPIIESSGAAYFNVLYLPFKKNSDGSVTIINNDISIEGPIPVCEKVWSSTKNCIYLEKSANLMEDFYFHGKIPEKDENIFKEMGIWYEIIKEKTENNLVLSNAEMATKEQNETVLTNFINDAGRVITNSDICFYNLGGIRYSWHKGYINEIDVFKMFPFNNTWIRFEMTGDEVVRLFNDLNGNMIYPATGVIQTYSYSKKTLKFSLKNIEIWDGIEKSKLDPKKTYKLCTNQFLANGGSGMAKVRQWYTELRNRKEFGNIRDTLVKYFASIKVINEEFYIDSQRPLITFYNED